MNPALSIVIPAYNEENTLAQLLERVFAVGFAPDTEIIVVNDGSTDRTGEILRAYENRVLVITHPKNRGKGAAVRTGFAHATGEYVVVQDGDLEYDPNDIARMFAVALEKKLPVVYGSRRLPIPGEKIHRGSWYYYLGGLGVTWAANLLYGLRLTDEPTCYKMVRRDVLNRITLTSEGFEFCPEVTAKIARLAVPIYEMPIHYDPRTSAQGKKIRAKDGFIALWTLLKNRF
jgi:glycosyltransferase involved in cell wall biosynthesis